MARSRRPKSMSRSHRFMPASNSSRVTSRRQRFNSSRMTYRREDLTRLIDQWKGFMGILSIYLSPHLPAMSHVAGERKQSHSVWAGDLVDTGAGVAHRGALVFYLLKAIVEESALSCQRKSEIPSHSQAVQNEGK